RLAVCAPIVDDVAEPRQRLPEMFLQREARVVGADRDAHGDTLYYGRSAFSVLRSPLSKGTGSEPGTTNGEPRTENAERRTQNGNMPPSIPTVTISTRGEERVRSGHPWIYRTDVGDVHAEAGDRVLVRNARGRTLGHALFSDRSQIAIRMLAYGDQAADDA